MMRIEDLRIRFGNEAALIVLLIRCYFKKGGADNVAVYLQERDIDWNHFYKLVSEYELRPLLYKIIARYAIPVDPAVVEKLKGDCLFIAGANLKRLQELLRLLEIFRENNIRAVPFKGVFLSQILFGDFSTRETCDIDFLVEAEDSAKITRILLAEGYQSDYYFEEKNEAHLHRISCERGFGKGDEAIGWISVEIHWEVLLPSADVPLYNRNLFTYLHKTRLAGREVEVLSEEDTLITLLAHHGVTDVWRTLKHVVDLAAFLERDFALATTVSFRDKLKKLRLHKTTMIGLQLAYLVLGIPLAPGHQKSYDRTTEKVLDNLLGYPMFPKFKYAPIHMRQHLQLRDSFADRLRLAREWLKLLFVPTANDLREFTVPKKLFFLYYFLKPLRLVRTRLRN